jgi:hypothetical protein
MKCLRAPASRTMGPLITGEVGKDAPSKDAFHSPKGTELPWVEVGLKMIGTNSPPKLLRCSRKNLDLTFKSLLRR